MQSESGLNTSFDFQSEEGSQIEDFDLEEGFVLKESGVFSCNNKNCSEEEQDLILSLNELRMRSHSCNVGKEFVPKLK
jgi:hypothetical protein